MIYTFGSPKEYVELRVNADRSMDVKNRITNGKFLRITERIFSRDREKRSKFRIMQMKIPKLTQDELDVYVILEFGKMGYKFMGKR